jgi:hypothetical protein
MMKRLLLLAVLVSCALAQMELPPSFTVNSIPGSPSCDEVRLDKKIMVEKKVNGDYVLLDVMERFRPNDTYDSLLFSNGGRVTYPAPGNTFELVVLPPPGWQPVKLGGVPRDDNGRIMGVEWYNETARRWVPVTSAPSSNMPQVPIKDANGTIIGGIDVPLNGRFNVDYNVQLQWSMYHFKRRAAAYGTGLDYVSDVLISLRVAEGQGRTQLTNGVFSHFKFERRPYTNTLETGFISEMYFVELFGYAWRAPECVKAWTLHQAVAHR